MSTSTRLLLSLAAVGLLVSIPSVAQASLDACGGVYLSVGAQCEFVPTETCTTKCEDVAMETSCAARLYADCEVGCTATAEVTCIEDCGPNCAPTCETQRATADPPNARGLCMSSCQQDCNNDCADSDRKGECRSSCAHTCGDLCEKNCDEEPATDCAPTCEVACQGSCTAQASSGCVVTCEAEYFATCKTELVTQCNEECKTTGGALFCDAQFLHATDLQACADQLYAEFAIEVDIEIDVECVDGMCEADGKGEVDAEGEAGGGCLSTIDARGGLGGLLMAMGVVGLGLARRRRAA